MRHLSYPTSVLSLHPSCLTSTLSCICPALHPSCPTSALSCIRPVLHPSCPASNLSCIRPVLHPSCPTSVLSCIRPTLHPICPACVLSCIHPVQHLSDSAYNLSCMCPVLLLHLQHSSVSPYILFCSVYVMICVQPFLHSASAICMHLFYALSISCPESSILTLIMKYFEN